MQLFELSAYVWCLLVSFALAVSLTAVMRRLAPRVGMMDLPAVRKIHARPMPLLGGLGVYLAMMGGYLLIAGPDYRTSWLMGGALVVLALGLWDDRVGLRARFRLAVQVFGAIGIVASGVSFHLFAWAPADYALSILWLVGLTNAMNCMDCADGIAAGVAAIAAGAFCLVALAYGHLVVAMMAVALLGACIGFLTFNFPRASIFLGDAGSTLLGLLVGALGIAASRSAPPFQQAWLAALPVAVPIWDIILVHLRRYRAGTRSLPALLESNGKDHLPHRLQEAGLRPRQVAVAVYLIAVVLAVPGVLIVRYQLGAIAVGTELVLTGLIVGERPLGAVLARLSDALRAVTWAGEPLPKPPDKAAGGLAQPVARAAPEEQT